MSGFIKFSGKGICFLIPEEYFPFSDHREIIKYEVITSLPDNLYLCRFIVNDGIPIIIFCIAESDDEIHYQAISRNAFYLVSLENDEVISVWKEIKKHCWVIGFQDSVYFLEIQDDIFEQLCSSFIKSLTNSIFTLRSLNLYSIRIDKKFDGVPTISIIPIGDGTEIIRIQHDVKTKTSNLPKDVSDPYISIDVPICFDKKTGELNHFCTVSIYEQTLWMTFSNSYKISVRTFQTAQKQIE